MDILLYIVALLVTLGILVTFHEFGHFVVARWCGVRVLRFSVGFGPALWIWRDRHDTEFAIAAVPLGGYVRMLDEREGDVPDSALHQAFNRKSPGQRIAIASAGPLANFLLAFLVYWGISVAGTQELVPVLGPVAADTPAYDAGFRGGEEIQRVDGQQTQSWSQIGMLLAGRLGDTGDIRIQARHLSAEAPSDYRIPIQRWQQGVDEPDLFGSLGIRPMLPAVVGSVLPDSPAEAAGLQPGDLVLAFNGEPVEDWQSWVSLVRAHPGEQVELQVQRQYQQERVEERVEVEIGRSEAQDDVGYVGVGPLTREIRYSFFGGFGAGLQETWSTTILTLDLLKKMVQGLVSTSNLSGPITIAKVAGDSAQAGVASFFAVLALLSISLGILNLLPIPILDGGHILFYTSELITGKPVPERVQIIGVQIGLLLVVGLMILAFYNDISRLF